MNEQVRLAGDQAAELLARAKYNYLSAADVVAEKMFDAYVKPFCDKFGAKFTSGMGAWGFYLTDENGTAEPDYLLSRYEDSEAYDLDYALAMAVLEEVIPYYDFDLGSVCVDYVPDTWGKVITKSKYSEE